MNQKSTLGAIFLVTVVFSFFLGSRFSGNSSSNDDYKAKYEDLRAKIEKIGSIDIDEYLSLKEVQKRHEKADQILAQILQIAIADFGLRASEGKLEILKSGSLPTQTSAFAQQAVSEQKTESGKPKLRVEAQLTVGAPLAPVEAKSEGREFIKFGEKAGEVRTEGELKQFLDSVAIKDLEAELQNQVPMSSQQVELMNGTFTGDVFLDKPTDPKVPSWQIEMGLEARLENGKVVGSHEIQLFKSGRRFSRSRSGRGSTVQEYMSMKGGNSAVLIDINDGDGYLQLYYFPQMNQFSGLYYQKKKFGKFERAGRAILYRR